MILVDSSIWADHLRQPNLLLDHHLQHGEVLGHPMVLGELMMGNITRRNAFIGDMLDLPQAQVATDSEVRALIERERLHGVGIGYIDAHLLAAALLSEATLWTRDSRLAVAASRLDVS